MEAKEGIRERVLETLLKGAVLPLKVMPLWAEAIWVGAFIAVQVEMNPNLKERLIEIDDKVFLFEAKDIGKSFYLHIKDKDIKIIPHMNRVPDCIMRGDIKVLLDIFTGKEDPDTVFFSRKLEINGDTAAAIHLKNILSSV